ncbi:hypothetical protein ABZP36_027349 [Zizania latifolia]
MDRREGRNKREREEEEEASSSAPEGKRVAAAAAFEDTAVDGGEEAWQRPPGVFEFPWQKCRGGLGVPSGGSPWELRDVWGFAIPDDD